MLTCTSSGGPVTGVMWQRGGEYETRFQASKLVTNTSLAAYNNSLLLNADPDSVIGIYTCLVWNYRGISGQVALELQG